MTNPSLGQPDPLVHDMRSAALLSYLTYIEEKRRLRRGPPYETAAFLDALDMVRNYVRSLVEPEPEPELIQQIRLIPRGPAS